eukprot:GHVU01188227.1.p2 GENE.GHVU01188227.1~~GHVU01188227.1.p2  ORF type:complete len:121 (+),score=5.37 GHVU01188227.1:134-496(+)
MKTHTLKTAIQRSTEAAPLALSCNASGTHIDSYHFRIGGYVALHLLLVANPPYIPPTVGSCMWAETPHRQHPIKGCSGPRSDTKLTNLPVTKRTRTTRVPRTLPTTCWRLRRTRTPSAAP